MYVCNVSELACKKYRSARDAQIVIPACLIILWKHKLTSNHLQGLVILFIYIEFKLTFDISPVARHNHQPKPKVNIKVKFNPQNERSYVYASIQISNSHGMFSLYSIGNSIVIITIKYETMLHILPIMTSRQVHHERTRPEIESWESIRMILSKH